MENISQFTLDAREISAGISLSYTVSPKRDLNTSKEQTSRTIDFDVDQDRNVHQARHRAHAARFGEQGLTPAEADVAAALVLGGRAQACAAARGITMNTLRTLRRRAYDKLDVADQVELMRRWGVLPPA